MCTISSCHWKSTCTHGNSGIDFSACAIDNGPRKDFLFSYGGINFIGNGSCSCWPTLVKLILGKQKPITLPTLEELYMGWSIPQNLQSISSVNSHNSIPLHSGIPQSHPMQIKQIKLRLCLVITAEGYSPTSLTWPNTAGPYLPVALFLNYGWEWGVHQKTLYKFMNKVSNCGIGAQDTV